MISHAGMWAIATGAFLAGVSLGAVTIAFFMGADRDDDPDADAGEYQDWRHG
jgi:hypothetical protein